MTTAEVQLIMNIYKWKNEDLSVCSLEKIIRKVNR